MTVAELIEELKKQPQDAPAVRYDDHTGEDLKITRVVFSSPIRYIPAGEKQYREAQCVSFDSHP